MATRVLGPTGSRRRRRFLLVPLLVAALAALFVIVGAQATPPQTAGFFELDKNLINNEQTPSFGTAPNLTTLGSLGGNINASTTSFTVCQNVSANPTTPITIQVEAERMTVTSIANASGGGCSGAFKRTYSVTRGVGGTTAASHGASGVQGYVTQVTFNTVTGDDWNQVFSAVTANGHPDADTPNPCSGANWSGNAAAVACDFIADPPGKSVFTTGGSKDDLDINVGTAPNITHNWMWTDSSVPDSDDITDGYAIKYQAAAAGSHQFLYFGADRTAVNGAKDMGFWFFKSPVSQNPDGTFSGKHTVGDLLLLGTFTNGGATTTIRVFKWDPANADTNGVLVTEGNFGDCVPGGSSNGCNTVNNGTIKSPWSYQSKISGTPANTIFAGGAMEGGVDLTALQLTGCFSTFLAETRSSPEIGAQLKDFLLGTFESCGSSLKTTPKDGSGNDIPAGGLSIGAGSVTAKDSADLEVTGTDTWSGTFDYYICGPVSTDTCNPANGVHIGNTQNVDQDNAPALSDAATLTSAGRYCWAGVFTSATEGVDSQTDNSAGECFTVNPVTPALTTHAVESLSLLSPKVFGGLADLNGDGTGNTDGTPDNSTAFYGSTNIIGGKLDCNSWNSQATPQNAGTAGNGIIDINDDCTLLGYNGTASGVTITVTDGAFQVPDGTALPAIFPNPATPQNNDISDSRFAWSTRLGRVDANGDETIDGNDCSNNVVNTLGILGSACGNTIPQGNGLVDVNSDGQITSADSCTGGCFLGHNVADGYVLAGTVDFGNPVTDIASLTGLAKEPGSNGGNATYPSINATNGAYAGTITFELFGPSDSGCGTEITASKQSVLVDTIVGNKEYGPVSYTPGSPGKYHWKATIDNTPTPPNPPASINNVLPVTDNASCDQSREDVVVRQIPTDVKTKQSWYPNDTATITSTAAGDLLAAGGTVEFTLYDTGTCTGNVLYKETKTNVVPAGGLHSKEVSTSNPGGGDTGTASYQETTAYTDGANSSIGPRSWKVVYTPPDSAHLGSSSICTTGHTESHSYTYQNDPGH